MIFFNNKLLARNRKPELSVKSARDVLNAMIESQSFELYILSRGLTPVIRMNNINNGDVINKIPRGLHKNLAEPQAIGDIQFM